jgi:hypothetical protein
MRSGRLLPILSALLLVAGGCTSAGDPDPDPTGPTGPADRPAAATEHRIGVRAGDGDRAEFYDRRTGQRWTPRGFNHWQWTRAGGYLMDRTFRAGDNDLSTARADLATMAGHGYNAVRIWASACFDVATGCLGDPAGGLREEYLANLVDYLWAAREHGLQVMFTFDHLPDDGGYAEATGTVCCQEWAGYNLDLTAAGVLDHERFWTDFVAGLIGAGAPLDAIWAFELRNEQFFEADQPPFGVLETVTTADGGSYDLTDPGQVRRMRAAGLRHYVDRMTAAIKAVDPTALVTMGFFPSAEGPVPVPPDARLVDPRPLVDSALDFFDFHAYPGVGLDWPEAWANSLLAEVTTKPVVLGEFGAFRNAYPDPVDAAVVMVDYQARACADGLAGFLYWSWSGQGVYQETWGGDQARIAELLSPRAVPDPCRPGPLPHPNLAFGRPATASAFEDGPDVVGSPAKAVDLSEQTWWSSGADAPQWIEIDLGGVSVDRVRLSTQQATEGPMQVRVRLLDPDGAGLAEHTFTRPSADPAPELVLEHGFGSVAGVATLRVQTQRPGWVIWYEVAAFGPG